MTVDVLLTTYNSTRFGPEMLESLLAQSHGEYTLLVRDDGSTDGTREMIEAFRPRFGGRMRVIEGDGPTGAAKANFAKLMAASSADHVFFADHDDVWKPWKIARSLALLKEVEARRGAETPALVFTNVEAVDGALRPLARDYWSYKKIDPRAARNLAALLVYPPLLGCAMAVNRALIRRSLPMPVWEVACHDWWAALVAAIFGETGWIDEPSMMYRIHAGNESGPKRVSVSEYARSDSKRARVQAGMALRRRQAKAVLAAFGPEMGVRERRIVEAFVRSGDQGFLRRRWTLLAGGYLYPDVTRNLGMLALV